MVLEPYTCVLWLIMYRPDGMWPRSIASFPTKEACEVALQSAFNNIPDSQFQCIPHFKLPGKTI